MTDLDKHNPQFTIALRGYDRLQVDGYISRLQRLLAEAEERARIAESEGKFPSHASVGPRIAEIFDLASAEAREARDRAAGEASAVLSDARERADALLERAEQEAHEIETRTAHEHERRLGGFVAESDELRAEVQALEERRARLLAELRRLHEALGSVAGLAAEVNAQDPSGQEPSAQELSEAPTRTIGAAERARPARPQLVAASSRNGSSAA